MSAETDISSMIVSLMKDLRTSLDSLTAEVHDLRSDLKSNQGDFVRMNTRLTELETWRRVGEEELRNLKPVAAVMDKMKTWVITGFAIFFLGGFIIIGALFLWSKAPPGMLAPAAPPYTAPEPSRSNPPSKGQRQQTMYFS